MDSVAFFFWGGMAALFLCSLALRRLDAERVGVRIARRDLRTRGWTVRPRVVRTIRRGRVEIGIWRSSGSNGGRARYGVAVGRGSKACRDCVDCVNEAIEWIDRHTLALR
jgi:hypothetical protein